MLNSISEKLSSLEFTEERGRLAILEGSPFSPRKKKTFSFPTPGFSGFAGPKKSWY